MKNLHEIVHAQARTGKSGDELERTRVALEQALQDLKLVREELASVKRVKDRFLAALSHELRTPLTPILIAVQTLARSEGLPEPARDALEVIRRSVNIESSLIDDLLDITGISNGKLEIDFEPVDLHAAIRGAVEIAAKGMREKNQHLTVALEAPRHRTQGDFARLQNLVWSLLKNASKFTREGGAISVRSRIENGRFVMTIEDNGIGIEHDAMPAIFEAFAQGDKRIAREFGGLGLGLALSRATVGAHGGTINAQSAGQGHGATFTVKLPLSSCNTSPSAMAVEQI